jgi:hypothetical protein
MGSGFYPTLHCTECGDAVRMVAVCENSEEQTETRFYECSNPVCRESFKARVPIIRQQAWIGLHADLTGDPDSS